MCVTYGMSRRVQCVAMNIVKCQYHVSLCLSYSGLLSQSRCSRISSPQRCEPVMACLQQAIGSFVVLTGHSSFCYCAGDGFPVVWFACQSSTCSFCS